MLDPTTISLNAGKIVAQMASRLTELYRTPNRQCVQDSVNKLCVRLVFCWYCDSAGLFMGQHRFYDFLNATPTKYWSWALVALFQVLDTPEEQRNQDNLPEILAFPYVGGDLFHDSHHDLVPIFNDELRALILSQASSDLNWRAISPTAFGTIFESTLSPKTRREGGMHYTSVENIHKVIDPLFLDELKAEFATCQALKPGKRRTEKLRDFQRKLSRLTFLDPACGSGNFLTETYLSLRRLENQVIRELNAHQAFLGLEELNPVKVSLSQFAGIEINGFAVAVAKTALWIGQSQMLADTSAIIQHELELFPLKSDHQIVCANALTTPWEQVIPLASLNYIMGNPPFSGARMMSKENKADLKQAMGPDWPANVGDLDLVSAWFKRAHDLMAQAPHIKTALVATNSICQGTAIANLWAPLLQGGSEIIFARRSFLWQSSAADKAAVYCVIVGFTHKAEASAPKHIYDGSDEHTTNHINAYLMAGPDAVIGERSVPLCAVPAARPGVKPIDGGHYLFTEQEKADFIYREPQAEPLFRRWYGGAELLQDKVRYCLYLEDCPPDELAQMPALQQRVAAVQQYRLQSKSATTQQLAQMPTQLIVTCRPTKPFLAIPEVSSSLRDYIPIALMQPDTGLCSNKLRVIEGATRYHLSVLTSSVHMAWVKAVAGRLNRDFSYSTELVYNNFPWPDHVAPALYQRMEQSAQAILDARAQYPKLNLAQLYAPEKMPTPLKQAHAANDHLVLEAYGLMPNVTAEQIFTELYRRYQALIAAKATVQARPCSKKIYDGDQVITATHINAYLMAGPDAFVYERSTPLCPVPPGRMGNQPLDGGHFMFTEEEKEAFLAREPQAAPYFHRWYGSIELLQGKVRYCLYLGECTKDELERMPEANQRIEAVRQFRLKCSAQSTQKLAQTPAQFSVENRLKSPFLAIPKVTSARRAYIPIAFMHPEDGLCSEQLRLFHEATLYHFSVLTSSVHMAWIKTVAGRIKMDYRYSTDLVYNNFPWPQEVSTSLKAKMEDAAQTILDARAQEQDASLAALYDQTLMPSALRQAHEANDRLVLKSYGFGSNWSQDQIFAALYQRYQELCARAPQSK